MSFTLAVCAPLTTEYFDRTENRLIITNVTKRHAGIFQCFVSNSLARVDGGAATLEVIPRAKVASSQEEEEDGDDFDSADFFDPPTAPPVKSNDKSGRNTPGAKGKKAKHRLREMIPPSRPNITRLTDESVMVRWSVPFNQGLPIEFFKVQFKEAEKRGSRWKTIDEDIPSHIRSYEVTGLKAGLVYRSGSSHHLNDLMTTHFYCTFSIYYSNFFIIFYL